MDFEEGLEAVDRAIAKMAPPAVISNRQLMLARRTELKKLHQQGHTWEAIAAQLLTEGIEISANTLKGYVHGDTKPSKAARARKEARTKQARATAQRPSDAGSTPLKAEIALPANATEATAKGAPVIARKLR